MSTQTFINNLVFLFTIKLLQYNFLYVYEWVFKLHFEMSLNLELSDGGKY